MAYSAQNKSHYPDGRVMLTQVTAGSTWASRGNTIEKAYFTWTADCSLVLSKDASSAEASIIYRANLSAGSTIRTTEVLQNYAGNLYVHTLTAKTILNITYK